MLPRATSNFAYDLSRHLGPDQPLFGVQALGLATGEPLSSIGDMVDVYAREISMAARGGPCVVAGYCFGTVLAVEVAERLSQMGEDVRLIISLDTSP